VNAEQQRFRRDRRATPRRRSWLSRYLTADHTLAEDLTVETFERALRRWSRFDPRRGGARTGLCQLARIGCGSTTFALRNGGFGARTATRSASCREVPPPSFGEGLSSELEQALAELSRAEREVVALRVVLELDGETASVCSGSVRARARRD